MSITIKDLPEEVIDNIKYRAEYGIYSLSVTEFEELKEIRQKALNAIKHYKEAKISLTKNDKIKAEYKALLEKLEND